MKLSLLLKCIGVSAIGASLIHSPLAAWTVAVENFNSYEQGTAVKDQDPGGTGFEGPWIETLSNQFWTPMFGGATSTFFGSDVIQDGLGAISGGGRHMRTLSYPQDSGVVYVSTLMILNNSDGSGSSQFQIYGDGPIYDDNDELVQGASQLIGGVRYDNGVIQIIDTSYAHVDDDPSTPDVNESRNLDALIPGNDGLTDDDPPETAYNEYYTLAETYVDLSDRETAVVSSILWVMKYDIDNATMSYYAFLPGDSLTMETDSEPTGASYSILDHPVNSARNLPVGNLAIAAWGEGVVYEHARVGTTFRDAVPLYNALASAPKARSPMTIYGTVDEAWDTINSNPYSLSHAEDQPSGDADASGTWKASWDDSNLYLLFNVTDDDHIPFDNTADPAPDPAVHDEVEFWTDTGFERHAMTGGWPPVYDANDTQWITRLLMDDSGNGFANRWQHGDSQLPDELTDVSNLGDDSLQVAGSIDGNNRTVEVSVSWADLGMAGPPVLGQMVGFETQINDRDASTGTDDDDNPVYESNGKRAWADGGNAAWRMPAAFGVLEFMPPVVPIFDYDFSDLVVDGVIDGTTGSDDDIWAGPFVEAWRTMAGKGAEPQTYLGDLAQSGLGIQSNEMGRLSRTLDSTFDAGVIWTSFVVGNDQGSTQLWLGDTSLFDQNDSSGITAGVRMHNGVLQVIDTSLSRDSLETYVSSPIYPNAPVLVVTAIDYEEQRVSYWLFESGLPIDPENPSFFYEFTPPRGTTLNPFSGIAWAGFFSNSVISNFRVGDDLNQVIPDDGDPYGCALLAHELHQDITVDGSVTEFGWARTQAVVPNNYWMDGGNNVLPADNADFMPSFHTGWFGDNLYIAVVVDDDDVLSDPAGAARDSVEIYLDGDNSDSASLGWPTNYDEVDDYQLVLTLNSDASEGADITGSWFDNPTGNPDGYKGPKGANDGQEFAGMTFSATETSSGYIVEIALDMTVVPGLDTFVNNGLMGYDVAVVDNDDTGEVDADDNPIIEKSHVFYCDDANWNWNGTAHFGTLHVAGPMSPVAAFGGLSEVNIPLEGPAGSGDSSYEIVTNFDDVAYTVEANEDWVTIDFDPGIGAGEMEFSWSENTGLYSRDARIQFAGDNTVAFNRIDLTQVGQAPDALAELFPDATAGTDAGSIEDWMGVVFYDTHPWLGTAEMGWTYHVEGSGWMWSAELQLYVYTTADLYPFFYAYNADSEAGTWHYVTVTEEGSYIYDFIAGDYLDLVIGN